MAKKQNYEYKLYEHALTDADLEQRELNHIAEEGWQLVSTGFANRCRR